MNIPKNEKSVNSKKEKGAVLLTPLFQKKVNYITAV